MTDNKIVRIRKLNDIDKKDWEITFDDGRIINHNHEHFFSLVERGLISEPPKPVTGETNEAIFFPKDDDWEAIRKREKEKVTQFRLDVKNMSMSEFNEKYPSKKFKIGRKSSNKGKK